MRAVAICLDTAMKEDMIKDLIKKSRQDVAELLEEAKNEIVALSNKASTMMGKVDEIMSRTTNTERKQEEAKQHKKSTYAQVVKNIGENWQDEDEQPDEWMKIRWDMMENEKLKNRQILIDSKPGVKSATEGLKVKEVVKKANMAWDAMSDTAEDKDGDEDTKPEGIKFIGAKILKNGGVVLEMSDEEGAEWLKVKKVKESFERRFGGSAEIKEHVYAMRIEFILTTFRNELDKYGPLLETENDMEEGTIKKIQWMRNPETSWKQDQQFAHAIITVTSQEDANKLLKNGITIEGVRRIVRKMDDDLRRCYKCQRWDV